MEAVPISTLAPSLPSADTKSFKGIVTLVWPYSSSTRQFALLVAEQDFRLRHNKGQVRIQFSAASAKAVARSGVGIGDIVTVSLEGVQWIREAEEQIRTPGKSVDWELRYGQRLVLQVRREGDQLEDIDVDNPTLSPQREHPNTITNGYINREDQNKAPALKNHFPSTPGTWASPAFLRRSRVSSGPLVDSPYDPFAESDEFLEVRASKRQKQWHEVMHWKFAENPPSPTNNTFWDDLDVEEMDEDLQEEKQASAIASDSPLRTFQPKGVVKPSEPTAAGTAVHDFALDPIRHESESSSNSTGEIALAAQNKPFISLQTDVESSDTDGPAISRRPEPALKLQINDTQGLMLPPAPPATLEASSHILSSAPFEDDSAKPQTPKLTAVPSSTLPLPSPFPAEGHTEFPFPLDQSSQELLPSPLTKAPPGFARPQTPELKAVSSWNLPLPSPFPAEGKDEPNQFFVSEDSHVSDDHRDEAETPQYFAENASPDQASHVSIQPDKDHTWKPGLPIQFQTQSKESIEPGQSELITLTATQIEGDSITSEQSGKITEESSDKAAPSSLFKLSDSDSPSLPLYQADSEALLPIKRGSQVQENTEEEEEEKEQAESWTSTPIHGPLPESLALYRNDGPITTIEITSSEESSEAEDENEDIDDDEELEKKGKEEDADHEMIQPSEDSKEGLVSSPSPDHSDSLMIEADDNEEETPVADSESSGTVPSEEEQSHLETLRFGGQGSSPMEQLEIESATTDSTIYPSLDGQESDSSVQDISQAFPFGFDGAMLSDPIPQDDGGAVPFTLPKEVLETVQADDFDMNSPWESQASSQNEMSYVFDDEMMQDEPDEEEVPYKAKESSNTLVSESVTADEQDSIPLPARETTDQETEQIESDKRDQATEEASAMSPTKQTTILDLGSSSDAENVNHAAARGVVQYGQISLNHAVQQLQTSTAHFEGANEIYTEDSNKSEDTVGDATDDVEDTASDTSIQSPRLSHPEVNIVQETPIGNMQNSEGRPMTPDASQPTTSILQPIPEDDSLNQASTKVLPPTPRLTQPSQGTSPQSSAPLATKHKMPTRRSTRLSSTPEATIQEAPLSSPSSQKTRTPTRRSAHLSSSSTPQPQPQTPERLPAPSMSPPSTKKTPTRRSQRLSSSPSQATRNLFDGSVPAPTSPVHTTIMAATEKMPIRRSERVRQRKPPRISDVPEALSPWFGPRRSREPQAQAQAQAQTSGDTRLLPGAVISKNGEVVIPDSEETGTSITTSSPSFSQETVDRETTPNPNGTTEPPPAPASSTPPPPKPSPSLSQASNLGIRTKHAYYTPLSTLSSLLNASPPATASILALASTPSTAPERARTGPRDWLTAFCVTDPGLHPRHVRVRVFRPYRTALPVVAAGDPVLLRAFAVAGRKRAVELVSAEASAWCVWRSREGWPSGTGTSLRREAGKKGGGGGKGESGDEGAKRPGWARRESELGFKVWERVGEDGLGKEEIRGPPVEFGDEEEGVARALRGWWEEGGLDGSQGKAGSQRKDDGATTDREELGEEKGMGNKGKERKANGTVVHELRDGMKYRDRV